MNSKETWLTKEKATELLKSRDPGVRKREKGLSVQSASSAGRNDGTRTLKS